MSITCPRPSRIRRIVMSSVLAVAALGSATALAQMALLCYDEETKSCCAAASVPGSTTCISGEWEWQCPANIIQNPLVKQTKRSATGKRFRLNNGQKDCEYQAGVCGSSIGSCTTGGSVTVQCTEYIAYGADCVGIVPGTVGSSTSGGGN